MSVGLLRRRLRKTYRQRYIDKDFVFKELQKERDKYRQRQAKRRKEMGIKETVS